MSNLLFPPSVVTWDDVPRKPAAPARPRVSAVGQVRPTRWGPVLVGASPEAARLVPLDVGPEPEAHAAAPPASPASAFAETDLGKLICRVAAFPGWVHAATLDDDALVEAARGLAEDGCSFCVVSVHDPDGGPSTHHLWASASFDGSDVRHPEAAARGLYELTLTHPVRADLGDWKAVAW